LVASLEAVQTTRDLVAVAVDPNGVAWAVGQSARLLERKGFYSRGGDGAQAHYRLEPVSVTEETA
jgi:hypothetical protein